MEQSITVLRNGERATIATTDYNSDTDTLWVDTAPSPVALAVSPALALINGKNVVRDIAIIPTLGQSAVELILARRPITGYPSLDAVWNDCPELLKPPFTADPTAIATWGG